MEIKWNNEFFFISYMFYVWVDWVDFVNDFWIGVEQFLDETDASKMSW